MELLGNFMFESFRGWEMLWSWSCWGLIQRRRNLGVLNSSEVEAVLRMDDGRRDKIRREGVWNAGCAL